MTGENVKIEQHMADKDILLTPLPQRSPLRQKITQKTYEKEEICVADLLPKARLNTEEKSFSQNMAGHLIKRLREGRRLGMVEALVEEFSLSSEEGIALMSLAEALLRTPDKATRDLLLRDHLAFKNWLSHLQKGESLFINATSWGLNLTGKMMAPQQRMNLIHRVLQAHTMPFIRMVMERAMMLMGEHFILGQTIGQALKNAKKREKKGFTYSYDMLGEAALDHQDAKDYQQAYHQAIEAVGLAAKGQNIYERPGVSVKLSALHPRYYRSQQKRVMEELFPILRDLARHAARHNISLTIDAEESYRLELSLDLFEALCADPALKNWQGLGLVVQAYGKRAFHVLDWVIDLARRENRRIMVRLVKGAYWDSEIKQAQLEGMADFPVFTRKCHTDVSYMACARKLLAATDCVFPQFATHNAYTVASIYAMAGPDYRRDRYEFQGLHGMGDALYDALLKSEKIKHACRFYAPVGTYERLLAYLVRRLLENGANSSFLNLLGNKSVPLERLLEDPVDQTLRADEAKIGSHHPLVKQPLSLFGKERKNSKGLALEDESVLRILRDHLQNLKENPEKNIKGISENISPKSRLIRNPACHHEILGVLEDSCAEEVQKAIQTAQESFLEWSAKTVGARAAILEKAADLLEENALTFLPILVREAGKSWKNAIGEWREAIDFLRYYGAQIKKENPQTPSKPLGVIICISPWNFPLAIFLGQIAAALAGGNVVVAKPSEETPLIAQKAVRLLWQAGLPEGALQLCFGDGKVGKRLIDHPAISGVMFTGSTSVARLIAKSLAGRLNASGQPVPLVAETGGLNSMIVDSSSLPEQVVLDVLLSAFDSAGQRCSALRLLCIQEEAAPRIISLLKGAMEELIVGNPENLATDIGPVITAKAQEKILNHIARLKSQGNPVYTAHMSKETAQEGTFVAPTLIKISSIETLQEEIFGPVLHVLTYARRDLPSLIQKINAKGFGLTFGIHSRLPSKIKALTEAVKAGNIYVNRNIVGAIVGVQPFGGRGLSGTGPKAGGPFAVRRLLEKTSPSSLGRKGFLPQKAVLWQKWLEKTDRALAEEVSGWISHGLAGFECELPSPVGESNLYRLKPSGQVLLFTQSKRGFYKAVSYALSCGNEIVFWPSQEILEIVSKLPSSLRGFLRKAERIEELKDISVILTDDFSPALLKLQQALLAIEEQPLPQIFLLDGETLRPEMLLAEQVISTNTAAAGGNAKLMAEI